MHTQARRPHKAVRIPERPPMTPSDHSSALERYEVGSIRFPDSDYYDRHLVLDHVVLPDDVTVR